MTEKRDLKADLELCDKATPGPWLLENNHEHPFTILDFEYADVMATYCTNSDAEFIIQAREGWPHAIARAMKAEALAWELVGVIDELRRQINECGLDGEMWDVYQKAKEVLGDGEVR